MTTFKTVLFCLTIVMLLAQAIDEDVVEYMRDLIEFRQGFTEALDELIEVLRSCLMGGAARNWMCSKTPPAQQITRP